MKPALDKTLALDATLQSPLPRETVKLVRADILAGLPQNAQNAHAKALLSQTVAMPTKSALAQTMMMAEKSAPAARALAQTRFQPVAQPSAQPRPPQPSSGFFPVSSAAPAAPVPSASPVAPLAIVPAAAPPAARVAPVAAHPAPPVMRSCSPTADARLMMLADPKGEQAASFRVLRDTLLAKGMPRVIGVSSPEAEDGKTTCAINLALALDERRAGKLLLIDANFANQSLAAILGVDETAPQPSWTAPFTLSALTPSLHVATLPRRPGQPAGYVDFTTFAHQLDTFQRAGYQHIILDMPTLDSSSEAKLLVQLAGGVLLAVRCGRSKTSTLRKAVERIGAGKALGLTLLDSPS